ncbi:MAG: hypothetical protein M1826_002342 [Phylliscum demangeonii]|nr:MAG: hypothetical protein M1826_002342 [Phylliscum demangeonii]
MASLIGVASPANQHAFRAKERLEARHQKKEARTSHEREREQEEEKQEIELAGRSGTPRRPPGRHNEKERENGR